MSDIDEAYGEQFTTGGHDQLDPPRNPEAKPPNAEEVSIVNDNYGGTTVDGKKVLKMWYSTTGWIWYGVEETEPGYWFGYVEGNFPEWGYWDENELNELMKDGTVKLAESKANEEEHDGTVWSDFHQKWIDEDELKKDRKARGFSSESAEDWWNGLSESERVAINDEHGITDWSNVDAKDNPMQHTGRGDYSVNIDPKRYDELLPEAQNTVDGFYEKIHGTEAEEEEEEEMTAQQKLDMWNSIGSKLYSKFGHLSKEERKKKGIWFGDAVGMADEADYCDDCKGRGGEWKIKEKNKPFSTKFDHCKSCKGTGFANEDWQQHLPKGMTIRGYECPICFMSIKFEKEYGGTGKNLYNHLLEKHGVDDSEAQDMVQTAKSSVEDDYEKVFKDYESPYTESKANEYLLDKVCPKCGSEIGDAEDEFENSYSITCPLCKETINRDDYDFTASPEWKLEGESKANELGAYKDLRTLGQKQWEQMDETERKQILYNAKVHDTAPDKMIDSYAEDNDIPDHQWFYNDIVDAIVTEYDLDEELETSFAYKTNPITSFDSEADSKSNQNIKNLKLRNQKRQWGRRGEALQDTEYPNPKYHGKSLEELLKIKDEYFGEVGNLDLGDDPDMSDYHDLMWEIGVKQGLYGHAHKTDEGLGDFFKKLSGRGDKTWGDDPITHDDFETMWNNADMQQRIKWLEDVQGSADGLQNDQYDQLPQWIQVQLFYHSGDLSKHEDLLETPTISLERSYDYYSPKKNKPRTKYSSNKAHKMRKGTGELTKDNLLKHIKSEGTYDPEENNTYNTASSIRSKTDQYLQELESEGWVEQKMQNNKMVWVPTRHGSGRVGSIEGGNGSGRRFHQQWMNQADKIDSINSEDMTKDKFLKRAKAIEIEYADEDQYRRMFDQLKDN